MCSPAAEDGTHGVDGLEDAAFPDALAVLRRRHPLLELRLQDGRSSVLLEHLASRRLDAVVIAHPPRALPDQLGSRLLLEEELVILAPVGASVRDEDERVTLKAVGPELTVSYPPESGVRTLIDAAARQVGATLRFPYTTNDPSLHVALARAGLGGSAYGRLQRDAGRRSRPEHPTGRTADHASKGLGVDPRTAALARGRGARRGLRRHRLTV